jgi:hypothetical protein
MFLEVWKYFYKFVFPIYLLSLTLLQQGCWRSAGEVALPPGRQSPMGGKMGSKINILNQLHKIKGNSINVVF